MCGRNRRNIKPFNTYSVDGRGKEESIWVSLGN